VADSSGAVTIDPKGGKIRFIDIEKGRSDYQM
jgi:hypothetical protein